MSDAAAAREWLTWLYGDRPDGLLWIGGRGDGFRGRTFTEIDAAVDYAMQLDQAPPGTPPSANWGVYHRLTTMRPVTEGRGTAADSAYLPAFAMDLDLRGPGHKALNYPENEQDLTTLLRKAGLPEPTVWVHSGGGRYPFWKLEQPVDLTLPGALADAAATSKALHRLVIEWAGDVGWKVDNTSDLARVYRLPGTTNRKSEVPTPCVLASPHPGELFDPVRLRGEIALAPRPAPIDPGPAQRPEAAGERLPRGLESDQSDGLGGGALFGQQDPWTGHGARSFTLAAAMAFVQPALEALRSARDGEINNRLNDASIMLAHFGEEFWSREAAVAQLEQALGQTDYDGLTWRAADTIASAYKAAVSDWRADRLPDPPVPLESLPEPAGDEVEALLTEMLTPEQVKARPGKRYLIKGLLHLDTESWLIGAPGSRKSFVALDMAGHVAAGRPWQGRKVAAGGVVIIAAEGAGGLGARYAAFEAEHGYPMPAGVRVLPRPVQATNSAAWRVLVEACRRLAPVLVIIDTQARVTVGLEENAAKDMGIYINAMAAVRAATGACVTSVHHTGRAGGDARGSSALDGAQDTELKVVALSEALTGELRIEKQKDLPEGAAVPLRFKAHYVGQDEDGDAITSLALCGPMSEAFAEAYAKPAEPWEIGHAAVIVQLFKVLLDQGETAGLTKAEARHAIVERFYGGNAEALTKSTYYTGWDRALRKLSASGDAVMVNVRGEKWTVDPLALANMAPVTGTRTPEESDK